jgi:hypothetical protein
MFEDKDAWIRRPPRSWRTPSIAPHLIELWCVEKDTDQVRGLAMERLEAAFLAMGWQAIRAHGARKEEA